MSVAYHINARDKTVTQVEYEGLADLQRMVEGNIELACYTKAGDTLFVEGEGMFKFDFFFFIEGGHQPFAGSGVIVGKEIGDSMRTMQPKATLAEVTSQVRFMNRNEARVWAMRHGG